MGLLLLICIGLLVYLFLRNPKTADTDAVQPAVDQLSQRNQEWIAFISGYQAVAKTKQEKAFVERMLKDIQAQGLSVQQVFPRQTLDAPESAAREMTAVTMSASAQAVSQSTEFIAPRDAQMVRLDNISLLLYFGAFLFVASVGLFIGFADASGVLRTLAVFLVMVVLYGGGVWLFKNKSSLQPAGLAFAGIGIAIAPLVGVAAYNFLLKDNPSVVWFLTSVLCLAMYAHALLVLRRPLINYIFMFTFLSLFESSVSIINAPIYYFGWAMAIVAIILRAVSTWKNLWPELQESSLVSSQLFLPLAVIVSLALVPAQGAGQLGVLLILAALYYGLEALRTNGNEQRSNAAVAHISILAGLSCLVYAVTHDFTATALALFVCNTVQVACTAMLPAASLLARNFATVLLASSLAVITLGIGAPAVVLAGTGFIVIAGILVWVKQRRADAYGLAALAWVALPVVFGQALLQPRLSAGVQGAMILVTLLLQLAVYLGRVYKSADQSLVDSARSILLLNIGAALFFGFYASPLSGLIVAVLVAIAMLPLVHNDKNAGWEMLTGIVAALPIIFSWDNPDLLLLSLLASLSLNILLALRYRSEANRWISTVLWLLLPIGFGNGATGDTWAPEAYAWSYIVVMLGLILSRAIARGVVFTSGKIPLASYAKTASVSYVAGYCLAAFIAAFVSLGSNSSQLHTTLILITVSVFTYVIGRTIEKRSDLHALQPILWQLILVSAMRPEKADGSLEVYLFLSSILAVLGYLGAWLAAYASKTARQGQRAIAQSSLIVTFLTPASVLFIGETLWPMPVGLLLAGIVLYEYVHASTQDNREVAGGVMVAALMWLVYLAGFRELQLYTHMIVATFGFYAYWRHVRGERKNSDNYLMLMLATATIPLALQALSGEGGGLYGWWLLLEQIAFMLLGMTIKRHFVTMWGLYVAIGAVLYQLRNLGWAALTVLALFLIGIAVYQLQKYNQEEPPKNN